MEEQILEQVVETPIEVQQPKEDNMSKNLAAMRKKLEEEERLRLAAERRADDLEKSRSEQANLYTRAPIQAQEEDYGSDPDDYVATKTLKKTASALKTQAQDTQQQVHQLQERLAYFEAKTQLDSIKDFNEVVNDDNLKNFARLYPRDYNTMMKNSDLTEKSMTAYNMIKNYGIYEKAIAKADAKIANNLSKPASANIANPQQPQTPLSRLNDYERRVLTEADKDRINKDLESRRSRG